MVICFSAPIEKIEFVSSAECWFNKTRMFCSTTVDNCVTI